MLGNMKFSFNQKKLLKKLENVNKAIDSMNVFLPLRNFFFDIQEDKVIIKGSNGNFSIETKIKANPNILEIEEQGSFLVPSTLFLNIVRKCDGMMEFNIENNNMKIKNERDIYEINLMDAKEYPSIDFELYGNKINVNATELREAIKNVIFAASQKEEEIVLNGVNLKMEDKKLIITATNSYRLAQEIIDINDDRNLFFDVTIHNKNIKDFIPAEANEEVVLYANDYKVNLVYQDTILQSKIIDVPYKDISKIFQTNFSKKIVIDRNVLSNAVSKATVITGDTYNKIRFNISEEQISISSVRDEIGQTNVILTNEQFGYEGEGIVITLNFKYLKEAINVFDGKIEIYLNNSHSIILITSEQKKNNKQIISPLRSY